MKHTTVYAGDRFEVRGADPELETTLADRSYLVETDFDLRFHVLLSYNSEVTFLCPSCESTNVPTWWQNRHLLTGYTVLHTRGPSKAACGSCAADFTLSFTVGGNKRSPFPSSYHGRFMWSEEFKNFMGGVLARHDSINMFETILVLDEMCEALMAIKGRLESERIRREVPPRSSR